MTTMTIEIPDKAEKALIDLIDLIGGRIITTSSPKKLIRKTPSVKNNKVIELSDLPAIIFMKFGYHAKENEDDIIDRKKNEFKQTGKMFWGYGGTICHPIKQVQPFLKDMHLQGEKVFLAMSFTKSKLENDGISYLKFSKDNSIWERVPMGYWLKGRDMQSFVQS